MNTSLLLENITNPALLFFFLGIIATQLKSDLEIPESSSKFISLYLLFSIGFKGGQELSHSQWSSEIFGSIGIGVAMSIIVPFYVYFLTRNRLGNFNATAVAAAYGSVSAVTFITAISYLEMIEVNYGGHLVAVMALMEAPAIVASLFLLYFINNPGGKKLEFGQVLNHALTNGSVLMVLGSLFIGYLASEDQARGIAPFTTDIFKGFLALFLLTMGIESGKKLKDLRQFGVFPLVFSVFVPLVNGVLVALLSSFFIVEPGNRFLLSVLVASASYIAVPAAMKISVPQANPGLYLPMALGITFPVNVMIGIPLYYSIISG